METKNKNIIINGNLTIKISRINITIKKEKIEFSELIIKVEILNNKKEIKEIDFLNIKENKKYLRENLLIILKNYFDYDLSENKLISKNKYIIIHND